MSKPLSKRLATSLLLCTLLLVANWLVSGSSEADFNLGGELQANSLGSPLIDAIPLDPRAAGHQDLSFAEDEERYFAIVWDGVSRSARDFEGWPNPR